MVIPCSVLASGLVFKANCVAGFPCVKGYSLAFYCGAAFLMHGIAHLAALQWLVPWLVGGHAGHTLNRDNFTYEDVATAHPATWFSLNPVQCLRTKLVYNSNNPCMYVVQGKEHLAKPSDIGQSFFVDERSVSAIKSQ